MKIKMAGEENLRRALAKAVRTADRCILHARVAPCGLCTCEVCAVRIAESILDVLRGELPRGAMGAMGLKARLQKAANELNEVQGRR